MDKKQAASMERLAGADLNPVAAVLTPEVRSGSSFSFSGTGNAAVERAPYLVVWAYRVDPSRFDEFRAKEATYVGSGMAGLPEGVRYRGSYAVTVSGIAPDFEYRTFWALADLSKLKDLNDYLHGGGAALRDWLNMILPTPVMRSEIMGLIDSAMGIPAP